MGYIELWLAKWNKCLIYSKQSGMGYACAEKTNIKAEIIIQNIHLSLGLKIPDYNNQETFVVTINQISSSITLLTSIN